MTGTVGPVSNLFLTSSPDGGRRLYDQVVTRIFRHRTSAYLGQYFLSARSSIAKPLLGSIAPLHSRVTYFSGLRSMSQLGLIVLVHIYVSVSFLHRLFTLVCSTLLGYARWVHHLVCHGDAAAVLTISSLFVPTPSRLPSWADVHDSQTRKGPCGAPFKDLLQLSVDLTCLCSSPLFHTSSWHHSLPPVCCRSSIQRCSLSAQCLRAMARVGLCSCSRSLA